MIIESIFSTSISKLSQKCPVHLQPPMRSLTAKVIQDQNFELSLSHKKAYLLITSSTESLF